MAIFQNCDNPFEVNFSAKPSSGLVNLGWIPVIRSFENDTACEIDSAVCFCGKMLLGRSKLTPSVNSLLECFSATSWQSCTGVRISHLSKNHSWSVFLQQTGTKSFANDIARKSTPPRVPHPELEKPISGQIFSQAPHWFPDTNTENQSGRGGKTGVAGSGLCQGVW